MKKDIINIFRSIGCDCIFVLLALIWSLKCIM